MIAWVVIRLEDLLILFCYGARKKEEILLPHLFLSKVLFTDCEITVWFE